MARETTQTADTSNRRATTQANDTYARRGAELLLEAKPRTQAKHKQRTQAKHKPDTSNNERRERKEIRRSKEWGRIGNGKELGGRVGRGTCYLEYMTAEQFPTF